MGPNELSPGASKYTVSTSWLQSPAHSCAVTPHAICSHLPCRRAVDPASMKMPAHRIPAVFRSTTLPSASGHCRQSHSLSSHLLCSTAIRPKASFAWPLRGASSFQAGSALSQLSETVSTNAVRTSFISLKNHRDPGALQERLPSPSPELKRAQELVGPTFPVG